MTLRHRAMLSDLCGRGSRAAIVDIADHTESLAETECVAVSRVGPSRIREFSTGRWLARLLLEDLGEGPRSIDVGPDRAPVWPPGIVGSISHGGGFCAVAVAKRSAFSSLGIDIEPHRSVEPALWEHICTDNELRWLCSQSAAAELGTVLFSAKESVYKAAYPLIAADLEFRDVELEIEPERRTFSCEILHPSGSALVGLFGHYRTLPEGIVTFVGIEAEGMAARPQSAVGSTQVL